MSKIKNFVYCFDDNYNIQAQCSMVSLLEKVSEKINIYIIHSLTLNEKFLSKKILNHKNLNKIEIFYHQSENIKFPMLHKGHVSEATYYRFFMSKYIDRDIESLVYLDSDILCLNDPIQIINQEEERLKRSGKPIGAVVEYKHEENSPEIERLNLDSDYFNAGVLIVNYQLWLKDDIERKLVNHMESIKENIIYWDQDVLNSFFNNNFNKIPKELNYSTSVNLDYKSKYREIVDTVSFFHYSGKAKPWTIKGTNSQFSEIYHQNFRILFEKKYHFQTFYKKLETWYLINNILRLKFLQLDFPIRYILESIKSLFLITRD